MKLKILKYGNNHPARRQSILPRRYIKSARKSSVKIFPSTRFSFKKVYTIDYLHLTSGRENVPSPTTMVACVAHHFALVGGWGAWCAASGNLNVYAPRSAYLLYIICVFADWEKRHRRDKSNDAFSIIVKMHRRSFY